MKIRRLSLMLTLLLLVTGVVCAHAESYTDTAAGSVLFTKEAEMESNFQSEELHAAIRGMQPGDASVFTVTIRNENETGTDWYMTNKVLHSLEDGTAAAGGAYTYILRYVGGAGDEKILYSSDTVGGEEKNGDREGLREATGALEDYFYLDTLDKGQSGTVALEVALDGETQGNDYQNTLADLQMNFAVELQPGSTGVPDRTGLVKTGDETRLLPYYAAMTVSGALLLLLSLNMFGRDRRERREV